MNAVTQIDYPSSAELRREFAAERIADDEIARAMAMRAMLTQTRAMIAKMEFSTTFPVTGWDKDSLLAWLADVTPACDPEMEREMRRVAFENLGGIVL